MLYLVLDLEMSGPDPEWNEVIQIGAVLCNTEWEELGRFITNVYPENTESFSAPSQKIHDLSLADLQDAPMMYEAIELFEKWILETIKYKGTDKQNVFKKIAICGQSVMYDINFLRAAYNRQKVDWFFSYTQLDLHQLSFYLFKILEANGYDVPRNRSLGSVASYFGLEREGETHNALEDSLLTKECLAAVMSYVPYLKLDEEAMDETN